MQIIYLAQASILRLFQSNTNNMKQAYCQTQSLILLSRKLFTMFYEVKRFFLQQEIIVKWRVQSTY